MRDKDITCRICTAKGKYYTDLWSVQYSACLKHKNDILEERVALNTYTKSADSDHNYYT